MLLLKECFQLDVPMRNGRIYPSSVMSKAIESDDIQEKIRSKTLFGVIGSSGSCTKISDVAFSVNSLDISERSKESFLDVGIEVLDTPQGRVLKEAIDMGAKFSIVPRGFGIIYRSGKYEVVNPEDFKILTFDMVLNNHEEE